MGVCVDICTLKACVQKLYPFLFLSHGVCLSLPLFYTFACVCMCVCCACTCVRECVHVCVRICVCACMRTRVRAYMRVSGGWCVLFHIPVDFSSFGFSAGGGAVCFTSNSLLADS